MIQILCPAYLNFVLMRYIRLSVTILLVFLFVVYSEAQNQTKSVVGTSKSDTIQVRQLIVPAEKTCWLYRSTDNLASLIGYFLVLIASYLTYNQWKKDQRWKRNEALFKRNEALMDRVISFSITPGSWNAMLMLISPDRDIPLWDTEKPEDRYVRVLRLQVAVALLPKEYLPHIYSPKESAIRDSFGDLLGRLSHLEVYRESELLNLEEIEVVLPNWVITLKNLILSSDEADQALIRHLFLYIHCMKMEKVITLFEAFEIEFRHKIPEYQEIIKKEIEVKKWTRSA